jgi:murein L,D-transpeptidase YafK
MLKISQILLKPVFCCCLLLAVYGTPLQAGTKTRIIVDTEAETLTVMRGDKVVRTFSKIAIGRYGATYFKQQGDNKTPRGKFRVGWINRSSRYYIFLGLTYPDQPAADRALQDGRISTAQWQEIRRALEAGKTPSQITPLGGYVGIHGIGQGEVSVHQQYNWTNGCVALTNTEIDQLMQWAQIGTPVEIR